MKKLATIFSLYMCVNLGVEAQSTYAINVEVNNINNTEGYILLRLYNNEESFLAEGFMEAKITPKQGEIVYQFKNVKPGIYSIFVIHDLNNNGELDTNFIRIPTEPYGISMKGKNKYTSPTYKNSVFELGNIDITISISL